MNYYDELGLTPEASAEEIHQAYRNLARLLHPDQHHDENLRRLAESQMKRLNAVHAILSDPLQRRRYDLSLREEHGASERLVPVVVTPASEAPGRPAWLSASHGFWLLIALIATATLLWYFRSPPAPRDPSPALPSEPTEAPTPAPEAPPLRSPKPKATAPAVTPRELQELRRELETARTERDTALARLAEIQAEAAPHVRETIPLPEPLSPPVFESSEVPQASGGFAGTWFYPIPRGPSHSGSLYPPEYIETVIVEEGDWLRGRYRALYRVPDRAISPEVVFRFEGHSEHGTAVLPWTGAGDARGEVRLRLLSGNSLEVSWTAAELGTQMGLVTGTAVLIRRRDP